MSAYGSWLTLHTAPSTSRVYCHLLHYPKRQTRHAIYHLSTARSPNGATCPSVDISTLELSPSLFISTFYNKLDFSPHAHAIGIQGIPQSHLNQCRAPIPYRTRQRRLPEWLPSLSNAHSRSPCAATPDEEKLVRIEFSETGE